MLDRIKELDLVLLKEINAFGGPIIDTLMIGFSDKYIWIPLYILIIYKIYKSDNQKFLITLICIITAIVSADQITSSVMKPYFARLRPCHDPTLIGQVIVVFKCGGKFSFASSHAANSMSLAFSYFLISGKKNLFSAVLIFWSLLVSFSRIYLGVHYPSDVIAGFLIGITSAVFFYWLMKRAYQLIYE